MKQRSAPRLPGRDAIVATAAESIRLGSKSFAMASKLFGRQTRERAWLLYAWCRACDDMADGQVMGHGIRALDDAPERLEALTALSHAALDGRWTGNPAFDGLRIVADETGLPRDFIDDLIAGFALDARGWRPETEADLYRYCYHVAGVVGCMMAVVMGVPPGEQAVLDRACDLGMAFQLANVARDVVEDAEAGRCYLPRAWLDELGIAPDAVAAPENRERLGLLGQRLAARAELFEASARVGTRALPTRSAWAVLAAAGIYGDIARKVAARGGRAWDDRVSTTAAEKLGWMLRALGQALRRDRLYPLAPRPDGLWTRPR